MAKRKKQNEEEPKENYEQTSDADDTFGLPEVAYKPIRGDEPEAEAATSQSGSYESRTGSSSGGGYETSAGQPASPQPRYEEYKSKYSYMEEEKPVWPKVFGVLAIVLVAGALVWFFAWYQPAEKAKQEQTRRDEAARAAVLKKEEEERAAAQRLREAEQRRLDSLAMLANKTGSLETLTGRTGRYYVVVASAIDSDLLTDYANRLVANGVTCRLIPPFGKTKFHRLAVDVRDSYSEAQSVADGLKGNGYSNDVWVIKY